MRWRELVNSCWDTVEIARSFAIWLPPDSLHPVLHLLVRDLSLAALAAQATTASRPGAAASACGEEGEAGGERGEGLEGLQPLVRRVSRVLQDMLDAQVLLLSPPELARPSSPAW